MPDFPLYPNIPDMSGLLKPTIPEFKIPDFERPFSTAEEVCDYFRDLFEAFEQSLDQSEEIGVAVANFGVTRNIVVHAVAHLGPSLVIIKGTENNEPVVLCQHLSQLSFLLIPVKRTNPEEPRRVIGFGAQD